MVLTSLTRSSTSSFSNWICQNKSSVQYSQNTSHVALIIEPTLTCRTGCYGYNACEMCWITSCMKKAHASSQFSPVDLNWWINIQLLGTRAFWITHTRPGQTPDQNPCMRSGSRNSEICHFRLGSIKCFESKNLGWSWANRADANTLNSRLKSGQALWCKQFHSKLRRQTERSKNWTSKAGYLFFICLIKWDLASIRLLCFAAAQVKYKKMNDFLFLSIMKWNKQKHICPILQLLIEIHQINPDLDPEFVVLGQKIN